MKKGLLILFSVISLVGCTQESEPQGIKWIPFEWQSARISGRRIDKVAMTLPAKIDNLSKKFIMQLDLGATRTMLYEKSVDDILTQNISLSTKLDTTKTVYIQSRPNPVLKGVNLKLGGVDFKDREVVLFKEYGTRNSKLIGTIGPDIFQDKILIIDYKTERLAVVDTLPASYTDAAFEAFKIENGRIKIPFQIDGKTEYLMFDTGSSIFMLSTSKENAVKIGGDKIVDSLSVPSWDKNILSYGLNTVVPIKFGGKTLDNSIVYYDEEGTFDYLFESENIWGLTGNAYFLNNVVIIDYKNNRFGVL